MAEQQQTGDFIEYLGDTNSPHGTTFLTQHTMLRSDPLWKRNKVEVTKDIVWQRDPQGPAVGQKGNRLLVAVSDLPTGVAEVLAKTPGFKRVNE